MERLILFTIIGYITGLAGFIPGSVFAKLTGRLGSRFCGALMGFTGGLLIAFICFEMLAPAVVCENVYLVCFGLLAGVVLSALFENEIAVFTKKLKSFSNKSSMKSALLLVFGIALHNIPEGMALGSMLAVSPAQGYKMAVIIAIHCFPEAIAVAVPLVESGIKWRGLLLFSALLAIPLAIGSGAGGALSAVSPAVSAILLSVAGGVMIYITCGEILPESKEIWGGRLSTVGAGLGFVLGVIITAKI